MLLSLGFALFLAAVVVLWLVKPFRQRCPECNAVREDLESPLCRHCGWVYEAPGDDDVDEDTAADPDDLEEV